MRLQQANAIMPHETPDTHLTIFEDLGLMVADSAYIHVMHPVDMRNFSSAFLRACQLLVDQFTAFHERKWYRTAIIRNYEMYATQHLLVHPGSTNTSAYIEEKYTTDSNNAGISIGHQLEEIYYSFTNLTSLLPQQSDLQRSAPPRSKRGAKAVIGVVVSIIAGALIGTYLGPYSQQQINAIPLARDMDLLLHINDQHHELLSNLEKRVNLAFAVIRESRREYGSLDNHITIWNAVIRQLEHRLDQFTSFVSHLQDRRLSPTWFTKQQLKKIHEDVLAHAKRNSLTPLPVHLSDYFQLDVSYVKTQDYLTAIIHVPASATPTTFKVYRYIPFPIPFNNNHILQIHAQDDIIAVGPNNAHKILSQSQLANCHKHYQKYICESPLITHTSFSSSCVGSLMDHNHIGIQNHCSLHTFPSQEMVFQTATNSFAIYSPDTFTGRGHCLNGTSMSALISRITKVQVPSGCSLTLRHHVITVPVNVIAAGQPWVQQTKWDTLDIPKKLFANEIKRRNDIQRLFAEDDEVRSVVESQLNTSLVYLQNAHETIAKDAETISSSVYNHQYYIIALAAVASTLFLILCVCMCCRYCTPATPSYVAAPSN
jgi:hypothetical protein